MAARATRPLALLAVLILVLCAIFFLRGRRAASSRAPETTTLHRPAPPPPSAPSSPSPSRLVAAAGARVLHEPQLRNGAFSGRVLNFENGATIAGALVSFAPPSGAAVTVTTDGEGRFRIEPPAPGTWTLADATAPGFFTFAQEWDASPIVLDARPGVRIDELTIFLRPDVPYDGLVLGFEDVPVVGAEVVVLGGHDHYFTDFQGKFTFHAPQDAIVEARAAGYGATRKQIDDGTRLIHQLTIKMYGPFLYEPGAASLRGRVVDTAGAPVAGATVRAEHEPDWLEIHATGVARTAGDGRFVLEGLDKGTHQVTASCDACAPATVKAETGTDITITVGAGGKIAGRAVDSAGAPVATFTVIVSRPKGLAETELSETTVVDPEGHFEVAGLPPGELHVRAATPGFAPSPPVTAHAGDEDVFVRLPKGGTVRGFVVERGSNRPLGWARVTIEGGAGTGTSAMPLSACTVTDEKGEFTLGGVPSGPRSMLVAATGHHMRLISVSVADGDTAGPYNVALAATDHGERPTIELVGIGAQMRAGDDSVIITGLVPKGGAMEAGMQPGDEIVAIDGVPITQIGFQDAVGRIRGVENTAVQLTIRRGKTVQEIVVVRRPIVF